VKFYNFLRKFNFYLLFLIFITFSQFNLYRTKTSELFEMPNKLGAANDHVKKNATAIFKNTSDIAELAEDVRQVKF
jgi:hypothetical protein